MQGIRESRPRGRQPESLPDRDARTRCYFGDSLELLDHYAWHLYTAQDRAQLVGKLKPNDFGLFDMHGNVREWCQTVYLPYHLVPVGKILPDKQWEDLKWKNKNFNMN